MLLFLKLLFIISLIYKIIIFSSILINFQFLFRLIFILFIYIFSFNIILFLYILLSHDIKLFFTTFDIIVKITCFLQEVTLLNLSQTISFCFCFIFNDFR